MVCELSPVLKHSLARPTVSGWDFIERLGQAAKGKPEELAKKELAKISKFGELLTVALRELSKDNALGTKMSLNERKKLQFAEGSDQELTNLLQEFKDQAADFTTLNDWKPKAKDVNVGPGFTAKQWKANKFTATELKAVGFNEKELKD